MSAAGMPPTFAAPANAVRELPNGLACNDANGQAADFIGGCTSTGVRQLFGDVYQ
jgi:hypothetical protein